MGKRSKSAKRRTRSPSPPVGMRSDFVGHESNQGFERNRSRRSFKESQNRNSDRKFVLFFFDTLI